MPYNNKAYGWPQEYEWCMSDSITSVSRTFMCRRCTEPQYTRAYTTSEAFSMEEIPVSALPLHHQHVLPTHTTVIAGHLCVRHNCHIILQSHHMSCIYLSDAFVKPIIVYGSEVWHLSTTNVLPTCATVVTLHLCVWHDCNIILEITSFELY